MLSNKPADINSHIVCILQTRTRHTQTVMHTTYTFDRRNMDFRRIYLCSGLLSKVVDDNRFAPNYETNTGIETNNSYLGAALDAAWRHNLDRKVVLLTLNEHSYAVEQRPPRRREPV